MSNPAERARYFEAKMNDTFGKGEVRGYSQAMVEYYYWERMARMIALLGDRYSYEHHVSAAAKLNQLYQGRVVKYEGKPYFITEANEHIEGENERAVFFILVHVAPIKGGVPVDLPRVFEGYRTVIVHENRRRYLKKAKASRRRK